MTKQQAINILNGLEQCLDDYCELNHEGKAAFRMAVTALELFGNSEQLPSAQPDVPDTNVGDINKFIDGIVEIFADIREEHGDDSVCGLCEYDGAYIGQSGDWCNECPGFEKDDCFKLSGKIRKKWTDEIIKAVASAQPDATDINVGGTIGRQAAIDALESIGSLDMETDRQYARTVFENLPPAQQWIPCSERLPDKYGLYLVTMTEKAKAEDLGFDLDEIDVRRMRYNSNGWLLPRHYPAWINAAVTDEVIAWMPLPEPYRGGDT